MKISIENRELSGVYDFVYGLKMKGKLSISRSKFLKLIMKKVKELSEDQTEILKQYAEKDEDGEAKLLNDGRYDISQKNNTLANKELNELLGEQSIIEYGEYVNNIQPLEIFLKEYDEEISGREAQAFATLIEAFENKEEK